MTGGELIAHSVTEEIVIVAGRPSRSANVLNGDVFQKNSTDVVSRSRPTGRNFRASYRICGLPNSCSLAKDEVMMASVVPCRGAML